MHSSPAAQFLHPASSEISWLHAMCACTE